jgi:hypothetical protein
MKSSSKQQNKQLWLTQIIESMRDIPHENQDSPLFIHVERELMKSSSKQQNKQMWLTQIILLTT